MQVNEECVPVVRYAGPHHQVRPIRYARSVILGRLSRTHQLAGEDENKIIGDVGRIVTELLELGYTSRLLRSALHGLRQAWTQPAVSVFLEMLRATE